MSTLIYSSILSHHGIKGQKWGVRRFQDENGRLTTAGKQRGVARRNVIRNVGYVKDKNDIVRSLSDRDKSLLGAEKDQDWIPEKHAAEYSSNISKTFMTKDGDKPVSFLEVWTNGTRTGQIAIATRSGDQYRDKGYAKKNVQDALKWLDKQGYRSMDEVEWYAEISNTASNKLAQNNGFEFVRKAGDGQFNLYRRKVGKKDT